MMIAQDVQWCVTVIRNASIRARQREQRFKRNVLLGILPEFSYLNEVGSCYGGYEDVEIREQFKALPKIEAQVLYCTFLLALTEKEIASHLNISQQQVSRIKRHALDLLRKGAV